MFKRGEESSSGDFCLKHFNLDCHEIRGQFVCLECRGRITLATVEPAWGSGGGTWVVVYMYKRIKFM
jgi:hypothetical protein